MIFDGDLTALADYVRHMADLMGLRDHTISTACGPMEDEGHGAECGMLFGQRRGTITFRADWPEWDAENLRLTVTHELLHLHLNPLAHGLVHMVQDDLKKQSRNIMWAAMTERLEYATDAIATEWAKSLPLPVLDTPKKKRKGKA